MTEQFSQEYIEYVLSDEALQEQRPTLEWGDVAYTHPSDAIGLIRKQPSYPSGLYEIAVPSGDVALVLDRQRKDVTWLPTLWQLLGVIEGAGWRWQRDMEAKWLIVKGAEYHMAEGWKDGDMLAAAQLAVRAIQGGEGG